MPKYEIIDKDDNPIGFVVIRSQEMQSMAPAGIVKPGGALSATGPVAEGVLFFVVTAGSTGVIMAAGGPGWLAASVGIVGGLSLLGVRAWRSAGESHVTEPAMSTAATVVKVEQVSSDGRHWVLREFDESLSLLDVQSTAKAVVDGNYQWARSVTTKAGGLSQTKHNKMQSDLLRLWYIRPLPNNANGYETTRQGKRFFDAVLSLPSSGGTLLGVDGQNVNNKQQQTT